ncbi:DNA recombination and repair protein RecF [Cutibacterium acnes JCM 18909]|nr:DNA recombination and repair protein RecF [Cutibacterium acnes JCM 18909]
MFVERLELVDFRSYVRADVPMTAGATTFIGLMAKGRRTWLRRWNTFRRCRRIASAMTPRW